MKKYRAVAGIRVHYDVGLYDDDYIEAEDEEEEKEIAKERAMEDVDINGADFGYDDIDVYAAWEVEEDE